MPKFPVTHPHPKDRGTCYTMIKITPSNRKISNVCVHFKGGRLSDHVGGRSFINYIS